MDACLPNIDLNRTTIFIQQIYLVTSGITATHIWHFGRDALLLLSDIMIYDIVNSYATISTMLRHILKEIY